MRRFASVIDGSGVAEVFASAMPSAGPARQLGPKAVLVGILLAIKRQKVAHLAAAHEILCDLPLPDQLALGVAVHTGDGIRTATYRQFEHTFSKMVKVIDPSPVPSFRGLASDRRAAHLDDVRREVDATARAEMLRAVLDSLLESSVPETEKARRCLAVDWTDQETWARAREPDDPVPSADPDASWGHAKRNAPGAKDGPFYGYYAQVAVMANEEGSSGELELIRRIAFAGAAFDPADQMAVLLEHMATSGLVPADILADCGYSFRVSFGRRLRHIGAEPVMDLHPFDRGPKGTHEGAVCANGSLYCPRTPEALLNLGPLDRGAGREEAAEHDKASAELERHRFVTHAAADEDGYERAMCPAAAGKIRCPLVASSLTLDFERPTVSGPPEPPPRCCQQKTITVPPYVNEKTRQKHPYPGAAWRDSYARRTTAERAYARLADPAGEGIRRGWCRLFGTAKNALLYALAAVAHNVRILISREKAREGAGKDKPKRRKRRYDGLSAPREPATTSKPPAPG